MYTFRDGTVLDVSYDGEIRIDEYELKEGEHWVTTTEENSPDGKGHRFVVNKEGDIVKGLGGWRPTEEGETNTSDRDTKYHSQKIRTVMDGDLLCQYVDKNGRLMASREKLHKQIVRKHLQGKKKAKGQPVFTILGGGSASGKSTFTKDPSNGFTNKDAFVKVDADNIKGMLPEYQRLVAKKNEDAAAFAHEESSALAKRTMKVAMDGKYNVMLDGTGDGSLEGMIKKIKMARERGMRIEGRYCTVSLDTAFQRSDARAKDPKDDSYGRVVPHNKIANTHIKVSQILPQIAKYMDDCKLYDTTGPKARIIAQGGNGKDLTPVKGMEKEWEAFLAKAKLDPKNFK